MAGNTFVTQSGLAVSATSTAKTCVTQAGATGSFTTSFNTRATQVGLAPTVWTAFRTRITRVGLSVSVITCSSSSYVPPAPTNLISLGVSSPLGVLEADLSWNGLDGFTYEVLRGFASEGESVVPIASGLTTNSYSDTGLTGGRRYFYLVRATNPCGDVTTSNEVSVLLAGFVAPPEGTTVDHLTATDVCCDGLWTSEMPTPSVWTTGASPLSGWVDATCPPTVWTLPRCADD